MSAAAPGPANTDTSTKTDTDAGLRRVEAAEGAKAAITGSSTSDSVTGARATVSPAAVNRFLKKFQTHQTFVNLDQF